MGLVVFHHRFIKDYSKLVEPLVCLTGKGELYSIFLAARDFRNYILGSNTTILTDAKAWTWLSSSKTPLRVIQRWIVKLQEYNLNIDWVPGKFNTFADALSRIWHTNEPAYRKLLVLERFVQGRS